MQLTLCSLLNQLSSRLAAVSSPLFHLHQLPSACCRAPKPRARHLPEQPCACPTPTLAPEHPAQLSAASYQARTLRHTAQRGSALLDLQHLTLTTRPAEPVLLSTSTCLRTTRCAVGCWKGKLAQWGGDEAQQATTSCTGSKGPRASDRRLSVSNIRAWQEDPAAEQLCCRWFGLSAQRGKSDLSRKVQAERTVMKHARHCWLLEESGRFTRTRGTRMLSAQ